MRERDEQKKIPKIEWENFFWYFQFLYLKIPKDGPKIAIHRYIKSINLKNNQSSQQWSRGGGGERGNQKNPP